MAHLSARGCSITCGHILYIETCPSSTRLKFGVTLAGTGVGSMAGCRHRHPTAFPQQVTGLLELPEAKMGRQTPQPMVRNFLLRGQLASIADRTRRKARTG
jgi:hypothetical protein